MPRGTERDPDGVFVDDIHAQHARLLSHLRRHGRTSCQALGEACDVPSVTKRISELRGQGWPIRPTRDYVTARNGGRRRARFYERTGDHPQGDLFGPGGEHP